MNRFPLFILSLRNFVIVFAVILIIMTLSQGALAGNGRFEAGKYVFCVSVRFNATPAQLLQIRTAFQNANLVFADATDGQQSFGDIHIVNDSGASPTAEYWINPGMGRAYATRGRYGVRNEHVNLFFGSNFQALNGADGDAYTIAHEHAHHSFGVLDEYSGPGGNAECAILPDTPALSFSIMDNYFTRGGRAFGGIYTLNEFCIATNHDPDNDTFQESVNHQSSWETIAAHPKRSAAAPAGLPIDAPPGAPAPTFHDEAGDLRVMLLLDRSGSMSSEQRLVFAKLGAGLFPDFVRNGDGLGVSSFADSGTVNFPLTTVTGPGTRAAARSAINSLVASGSTNIGGGLLTALGQITSQPDRSCNEIIVLLSDGDHNVGTPPSAVIGQLRDAGVTVLTVGVGSGISASGEATLQDIANQTGGKYYRVSSAFSLVGLFFQLVMESIGNGLLAHAPLALNSLHTTEIPVSIEPVAANATFGLTFADSSDDIALSLRSPSGVIITQNSTDPNVQYIFGPNSKAFQITAPEAGTWTMIVTTGVINTGIAEVFAFADHEGVQLSVSVTDDTVVSPQAVEIQATPTFAGQNVTCAQTSKPTDNIVDVTGLKTRKVVCPTVTGTVIRPSGSSVPIELFDDGLAAAHADAVAGDGVYSARFNGYQGVGTYTFDLTATVVNGVTYSGESLFSLDPSNSFSMPPFTRSASTTAVVSGVTTVPSITGVNPNQGNRGQTLNITITGADTHFVNGSSAASFSGTGITVNSTTVSSSTSLVANVTIAAGAALGARDVTVTTGGEIVTAPGAFQIINSPPNCAAAVPSVTLISPPNRSFIPVNVLGITDPDNDAVTIAITTVRQDEPVDHIGDGSFVPDAVIGGSTVQVRAEAIIGTVVVGGTTYVGNGRFYHIGFTATDTANSSCSGIVKVAVPHTRTATPIDGGALFNSLTSQPVVFSYFENDKNLDFSLFRPQSWFVTDLFGMVRTADFGLSGGNVSAADLNKVWKRNLLNFRS